MEKILTIVIPTYNMQDYLRRCLDSLIVPEEQMQHLEVLVVNDGSKDNSSVIAHKYQNKYPDTFRVIDKENGNYGSCVNRGLKEATGKYIKILDADDWFDNEAFIKYLMFLDDKTVDLILTPFVRLGVNNKTISIQKYSIPSYSIINSKEFTCSENLEMHAFTYRTGLLRDCKYTQSEGISYTDTEWVMLPLPFVKSLIYVPLNVYSYFIGRAGQTMDHNVIVKRYGQLLQIVSRLINYFSEIEIGVWQQYINNKIYNTISGIYRMVLLEGKTKNFDAIVKFDKSIISSEFGLELNDLCIDIRIKSNFVKNWRKRYKINDINIFYRLFYRLLLVIRKLKH